MLAGDSERKWQLEVKITGKELKSKFSLEGDYTAGIEELVYEID